MTSVGPGGSAILDTFPSTLSSSWAQSIDDSSTGAPILTTSGGHLIGPSSAISSSIYWQDGQFAVDCEVCVTVVTKPPTNGDNIHLGLRITNPSVSTAMTGYQCYLIKNASTGDTATFYRRSGTTLTSVAGTAGITWNAGDRFCFRAQASTLTLYRSTDGGATWILTFQTTDSTYTTAGFVNIGGRPGWVADDFGAASLTAARTVPTVSGLQGSGGLSIATTSPAETLGRVSAVARSVSSATSLTLIRQTIKPMLLTQAQVATQAIGRVYAVVLSCTQKAGHGGQAALLTASSATSASLAAIIVKLQTFTASSATSPVVIRQAQRVLSTATQMALPPIMTSASAIATLSKTVVSLATQALNATITTIPTLTNAWARTFSAVQASSAMKFSRAMRILSDTSGSLASVASQIASNLKVLSATQAQTVTFVRAVARTLAATPVVTAATISNAFTAVRTAIVITVQTAHPRDVFRMLTTSTGTAATNARAFGGRTLTAVQGTAARIFKEAVTIFHGRFDHPRPRHHHFDPPKPRRRRWP
jgi:hypothetical protein